MEPKEFTIWLASLAERIEAGKASVALVAVENDTASIAAAGDDAVEAMMHLILVANTQQSIPDNVTLN